MVAASKMRKAQESMQLGKPYATNIRNVVSHIANANPEYQHVYMKERPVKKVGYIVVSSDRGLCGGLNINVFKAVVTAMKGWSEQGAGIQLCAIGSKAASFFNSYQNSPRSEGFTDGCKTLASMFVAMEFSSACMNDCDRGFCNRP